MALEINVYDSMEFEQMIINKDYKISKAIVDTILKNLNGKKRHYHALSVNVESEMLVYDITVDKVDFKTVLENNMKVFELEEEYEYCAEIKKAIEYLIEPPKKKRGRPRKVLGS